MTLRRSRAVLSWRVLTPTAVVFVGVIGLAIAAIPDGNGQIHGCYSSAATSRGGMSPLLLVDPAHHSCPAGLTPIAFSQTGPAGPPGPPGAAETHAHVLGDGSLDAARSSPGISLVRVEFGAPSTSYLPVYCFRLPTQAENVVATPESSARKGRDSPSVEIVAINATAEPNLIASWGCPLGTNAAVLSSQRPNSPLYAAFE